MSDPNPSAAAGFRARYGTPPTALWSAPGRVNLIGEHTDYNDGFVLPFAIDRRTSLALRPREDGILRVSTGYAAEPVEVVVADLDPTRLAGWSAYVLGAAWAVADRAPDRPTLAGADLHLESSVPVGAGLSSSAAVLCAVTLALDDLWGLGLDRTTLARLGQLAENRAVGAPTGIMDEMASLYGSADHAVFLDCRSLQVESVQLDLDAAGLELLVIDTGVSHAHATGGYAARRASCERGAQALGVASLRDVGAADLERARGLLDEETFRRVRHVVTENQRVLDTVATLREAGPAAIGDLLLASHASMRDDFEISVPELDLAVDAAHRAGALGARMTGGGFGGAVIALTPVATRRHIEDAVSAAFADAGHAPPTLFTVTPSAGARRDD